MKNRKVEIGDIVTRRPMFTFYKDERNSKLQRGTVVYIHPEGRYHTVEFEGGIRESYYGVNLILDVNSDDNKR